MNNNVNEAAKMFRHRLVELLEVNNMTQKELAELSDTTEAAISRYVNGHRVPNAFILYRLAQSLNCSVDYLLGRD